jgi:hypothetical protein
MIHPSATFWGAEGNTDVGGCTTKAPEGAIASGADADEEVGGGTAHVAQSPAVNARLSEPPK